MKYLSFLFVFFASNAFATGQIAGTVLEKTTGEALHGANIIIINHILGAAADTSGKYYIANVPQGIYSIRVAMMGYHELVVNDVQVRDDSTTWINFELEPRKLENTEIIIWDPPPIVHMDYSHKAYLFMSYEIISMTGMLTPQQTGCCYAGIEPDIFRSGIKMRAATPYANRYIMDEMPVFRTFWSGLANTGFSVISHMRFLPGGYAAEYGNSSDGIVDILLIENRGKIQGDLLMNYTPGKVLKPLETKTAFKETDATLCGAISKNMDFTLAYHDQKTPLPLKDSKERQNTNLSLLTLCYRPSSILKIKLYGQYQDSHSALLFDNSISEPAYLGDNYKTLRVSVRQNQDSACLMPIVRYSNRVGIGTMYMPDANSFFEFYLVRQHDRQSLENFKSISVTTGNSARCNYAGSGVNRSTAETWACKLQYNRQITYYNLVKTGFEYLSHDFLFKNSHAVSDRFNPSMLGFFVQDRIETPRFTANIGVRLERFDQKVNTPKNRNAERWKFSPRVGITFPCHKDGKVFANYSTCYQLPDYISLILDDSLQSHAESRKQFAICDGHLPNTKILELGFEQEINYIWMIFASVYYKEANLMLDPIVIVQDDDKKILHRDTQGIELGTIRKLGHIVDWSIYYDYMGITDYNNGNDMIPDRHCWTNSALSAYINIHTQNSRSLNFRGLHPLSIISLFRLQQIHSITKTHFNSYPMNFLVSIFKINKQIKLTYGYLNIFISMQNIFNKKYAIHTKDLEYSIYPRWMNVGVQIGF